MVRTDKIMVSVVWVVTVLLFLAACAAVVLAVSGCSGVQMNARYTELLNKQVAFSEEFCRRAQNNQLAPDEMAEALCTHRDIWREFQAARYGRTTNGGM